MLSPTERMSDDGKHLFQEGVEELKKVTRRYARKQKRWITNRFLSNSSRNVSCFNIILKINSNTYLL